MGANGISGGDTYTGCEMGCFFYVVGKSVWSFPCTCSGYGVSLWYPTYVEQINERAQVDQFYSASCNSTISNLVLGTAELARLRHCSSTSYQNVTFDHAKFDNWIFSDSLFNTSVFKGCVFNGVTFQRVNLTSAHFVNGSGTAMLFDFVVFNTTSFCGFNTSNTTIVGGLVINTTVNSRPVTNQTYLLEALQEGLPPPTPCAVPPAGLPYSITADKYQVYQESFYVAGSALPGNVLSAVAVYFLRRNYWLGKFCLYVLLHLTHNVATGYIVSTLSLGGMGSVSYFCFGYFLIPFSFIV